ncbi:chemotaxis protein CheW [Eubacteriales bacterium OttesenSCG-928-N14]|nr:chemotaxis protein CheW [Eubacteriales bacterium OttesenSCG-928-N14]
MQNQAEETLLAADFTPDEKYLTFFIDEQLYGISVEQVIEIIGIQPITRMPEMPEEVEGIINLRGSIVPLLNIRIKFNKQPAPFDDKTCIIVIEDGQARLGLIVDRVADVVSIEDHSLVTPPDYLLREQNPSIKGIVKLGDMLTQILDCSVLFAIDEIQ